MSDIPDDIAKTATDVLCEALTAARAKTAQHGINIVAAAILAERESTACRADKWADDLDGFKDKAARDTMRGFAAAIRRGTP